MRVCCLGVHTASKLGSFNLAVIAAARFNMLLYFIDNAISQKHNTAVCIFYGTNLFCQSILYWLLLGNNLSNGALASEHDEEFLCAKYFQQWTYRLRGLAYQYCGWEANRPRKPTGTCKAHLFNVCMGEDLLGGGFIAPANTFTWHFDIIFYSKLTPVVVKMFQSDINKYYTFIRLPPVSLQRYS